MTSKSRRLTQIIQNANTKDVTFDAVTINGALTLNGTTTTINSTTVTVDDPIFTLGGDTAPTVDDNKDRGIEFRWHNGTTPKIGFFGFDDSTGYLTFIPDATNTAEVFSGALGDIQATNFRGALIGNATTATTLQTARTINGTSFNGSANITITANTPNSLTLSTSGVGLSGSATFNGGTATTFTVTSNATSANTASTIVARDASGNFSAGTITASLTGTATNASNIDGQPFNNSNINNPVSSSDNLNENGIGYVTNISLFGQTDGALYSQAYSSAWQHQIYGDYRTGQTAIRGKNNGTWQPWYAICSSGHSFTNNVDLRAPIFYDSNNTGFYVDPASTTQLHYVLANNWFRAQGGTGFYYEDYGYGQRSAHAEGNSFGNSTTHGTGRNGWTGWGIASRYCFMADGGGNGGTVGVHDNNKGWVWRHDGNNHFDFGVLFANDVRAQIFYDSNNTGYYLDPTSVTALRTVGDWRADSASWSGEFAGKMQYHSTHWYIQYQGTARFRNSGGGDVCTIDSSGNLVANGNVTAFSDARLKENVATIDNALEKTLKLRGVYYNKIGESDRKVGVIAQEVKEVLPEVVLNVVNTDPTTKQTTETYAVDYGNVVGLLIEAIKEQQKQIDDLKHQIAQAK